MPVPLRSGNPKADAKYNVTTEFPNLGLHAASASGNVGLVEYALSNGQPVNSVLDGVLPLHAACAGGNEQVVKVLLDHGADVNAPRLPTRYSSNRDATALKVGESGSTPLHFASANGHTNIVSLLLLKGARADHADKRGVTPGMLAKQEGWLECEQLLRTWLANKDKDLRERPKRTNSSGHTEEQDLRKRVQVKRSIDTALNMLKASGTNLTESYHKASPSHQTVPLSSSPPASPTSSHPQSSENLTKFGEYTFYPISPIDDRPIDPNARRPSLPHLSSDGQSLLPEPLVDGGSKSRRRIHRRPRSAGNDSNPSDTTSSRRLGPKYSFMNLFKGKDCGASTPSGVAASLSRASATGSSVSLASRENPSASTASLSRHRHRMGSDAARQGSQSLLVSSPPDSPSRPPLPLAVDLHNALAESARNAHTRDRSTSGGSSRYETGTKPVPIPMTSSNSATRSTFESGSAGSWFTGSPGSHKSTSPIARLAAVREQERTHQRDRSTSRASRDDSLRPSLMGESGYASSALRAVRYDSASSVGSGTARRDHSPGNIPLRKSPSGNSLNRPVSPTRRKRLSGSAPGVVSELEPPAIDEDEDDDYSYGHLLDSSHRRPMHTKPAPISIISNRGRGDSFTSTGSLSPILSADLGGPKLIKADFPFSLEDSPAVINESALLTANTTRSRGDSLSSMGTNTTTDDSQLLSASGFTNSSGGSATVISPSLAGLPEHPDGPIGHPPLKAGEIGIVVRSETGEPSEVHVADSSPRHISGSFKDRRNHTPEELDLRSGSDTEERVQKAKKDILDLGNDSEAADQLANLPLSARLAAFGEALEKQQRQTTMKSEPPKSASNRPPIPPRSPQRPEPVVRQQSLEAPASNRVRKRTKVPRRPHTSQGDDGTKPSPLSKSFRPLDPVNGASRQHLRSASAVEGVVLDQDDKEGDIEDFVETPITAIPSSETRKLFRSPLTPMNPPKPLTPQPSASNPRNAVADDNYVHSRVASLDIDPDGDISFGVPLTRVSTAPNAGPGSKQTARSVAQAHKLARMGFPSQEAAAASTGSYRAPSALGTATTSSSSSSKRFGGLKSWFKGSTKAV